MLKFAPEGYPYILFFSIITIIAYAAGGILVAFLPFLLTLFMFFFFRDPERKIPEGDNIFVSPADGKVIVIKEFFKDIKSDIPALLKDNDSGFKKVSIFMSPLNVHVNRSPCDGLVESVVHKPGKFLSAFKHEASLENEQIAMLLNTSFGKVLVCQVAGSIARRAVCRVKEGDTLKKGERYGVIKFSSRVDIFLPLDTKIKVQLGEKVKAGETIVGEIIKGGA